MKLKSVGIIGGYGPETTAEFYLEIVFGCQKFDAVNRPLVLISNVPSPYTLEKEYRDNHKDGEKFVPFLTT